MPVNPIKSLAASIVSPKVAKCKTSLKFCSEFSPANKDPGPKEFNGIVDWLKIESTQKAFIIADSTSVSCPSYVSCNPDVKYSMLSMA